MTHLPWKELAEGMQKRLEERCAADGHHWKELAGEPATVACYWCQAVEPKADVGAPPPDWRALAVEHATTIRALLSVRDLEPGSNGDHWLEAARSTIRLDDLKRREGIELPGAIVSARP